MVVFKTDKSTEKLKSNFAPKKEIGIFYFLLDIFPLVPLDLDVEKTLASVKNSRILGKKLG